MRTFTLPLFLALPIVPMTSIAATGAAVDFVREIQPILENHCVSCHNPRASAVVKGDTDYCLDTKAAAIRGKYIVPGQSEASKVYKTAVAPDDDDRLMPPLEEIKKGTNRRLTKEETETLKKWIDEGAAWPADLLLYPRKDNRNANKDEASLVARIHKHITATTTEKSAEEMKAYTSQISGSEVKFDMVPIPGGKFDMGSDIIERGRNTDEGPRHEVTIAPFWMGRTEVTWNEYELFQYTEAHRKMQATKQLAPEQLEGANASNIIASPTQPYVEMSFGMGTDGFPAISMTQHAALKYCQWLSARTGHFYRLPTEAEWEYAARAGTRTTYYWGDDPALLSEYAWWGKNSDYRYHKVGTKKPNAWGLYDMIGNVAEWTLDQHDAGFYSMSPSKNPWNKATRPYSHVVRGGSWDDEDPTRLRSAVRMASTAEWKRQDPCLPKSIWYFTDAQFLGFRIVRPLKTPSAEEMQKYWNSGVEHDDPRLQKAE